MLNETAGTVYAKIKFSSLAFTIHTRPGVKKPFRIFHFFKLSKYSSDLYT